MGRSLCAQEGTRRRGLLETGCSIAQGLETTVPIWKIESILKLELWFMILCFSARNELSRKCH